MNAERWQQVKEILNHALEREGKDRAAFLAEACAGDESLREEVEALIASHGRAETFFKKPAVEDIARMFAADQPDPRVGQSIGPYQIISKLGAGGMGEVYLAQDPRLGRKVAVKLLPAQYTQDPSRLRRFKQEARAASGLNHPNILTIHEIGEANDVHFMATEFIEGETLRTRIKRSPLKISEALEVSVQVASALAVAHEAGIMHRDIKPENIMIRLDGYVKVLDFGLAKLTERRDRDAAPSTLLTTDAGIVLGTVAYMSPEQIRGLRVDTRTDIWSLGVVLYEMVTGHAPFEGETQSDVLSLILQKEPPPLTNYSVEAPAKLGAIMDKALRKDQADRYQTARDLLSDLRELKRRLEFEAELERSVPSDEVTGLVSSDGRGSPVPSVETIKPHLISTAEYVFNALNRHKRATALLFAVLIIGAGAFFAFSRRAPAFTEKDTILLADFVNTTGDPVFDGTLKQALAVQLGQSPFLNIYSDQQVREALTYMGRSPDERVTNQIAREICERQGIKAMLMGSVASLGSRYTVTLEALNVRAGDSIAREQRDAESKEAVLRALGEAATRLRGKLGESLGSIQKFDAPIEQATTTSLEALKAFTLGNESYLPGKFHEAMPFFKRAVEIDPNFALAYGKLAALHYAINEEQLAAKFAEKAFELRGRTSEREKFYISNFYYAFATGEVDKSIEVLELWKQTYPRDVVPRTNLSLPYLLTGQYEKAIEEAGEALRLSPNRSATYNNLGLSFLRVNRFDEARAIFQEAVEKKLDPVWVHFHFYTIAFVQGDGATMQRQIEWANGKPGEELLLWAQAEAAAFSGQRRKSRELVRRSIEVSTRYGLKEGSAWVAAESALMNAAVGDCRQTKESAANALSIARSKQALMLGGIALALCGEISHAQSLAGELVKRYPKDTFVNTTWLPTIQAAVEIDRGNAVQAIESLRAARRFEMGSEIQAWPAYVRGLAYLRGRAGTEAMAEFQKIIDHRGVVAMSPLYPLAHLGLARAAALTGDKAKSRKAYQDFLALWKNADPDLPILKEAQREYEQLKLE